jgi:hypothetical protein
MELNALRDECICVSGKSLTLAGTCQDIDKPYTLLSAEFSSYLDEVRVTFSHDSTYKVDIWKDIFAEMQSKPNPDSYTFDYVGYRLVQDGKVVIFKTKTEGELFKELVKTKEKEWVKISDPLIRTDSTPAFGFTRWPIRIPDVTFFKPTEDEFVRTGATILLTGLAIATIGEVPLHTSVAVKLIKLI